MQLSRRGFLRSVGVGAALAGAGSYYGARADLASPDVFIPLASTTMRPQDTTCGPFPTNSLFAALEPCCIGEPLAEGAVLTVVMRADRIRRSDHRDEIEEIFKV